MFRKTLIILIASGAAAIGAEEDYGQGRLLDLNLGKAIRMALEKNYSITAQKYDPKISRQRERATEGKFDPAFSLSFSTGENTVADRFARSANGAGSHFSARNIAQTDAWSTGVSGVTVWGLGSYASYGYLAGTGLRPINDVAPPVLK